MKISKTFPVILPICIGLAGCVTAQQQGPRMGFKRIDGKHDAKAMQQYEIDKAVCIGETQKSAVGMSPIYYQGIVGAIQADMVNNQRQAALLDIAKGCMAEHGYVYGPVEETAENQAPAI